MRRLQIISLHSDAVHVRVTIGCATQGGIGGSSTSRDDIPVQAIVSGASLSDRGCPRLTGCLHAIEESPPLRDARSEGIISVVLNGTSLPHVSVAFLNTMLAGECPSSIRIFGLLGISIRPGSELSDIGSVAVHKVVDLFSGVGLAPRS